MDKIVQTHSLFYSVSFGFRQLSTSHFTAIFPNVCYNKSILLLEIMCPFQKTYAAHAMCELFSQLLLDSKTCQSHLNFLCCVFKNVVGFAVYPFVIYHPHRHFIVKPFPDVEEFATAIHDRVPVLPHLFECFTSIAIACVDRKLSTTKFLPVVVSIACQK